MPRAAPAVNSFNGGELSPLLGGRTDLAKYAVSCAEMEGFLPTVQGPAVFRPGTRFVDRAVLQDTRSWLSRFEFNYEQASILEFNNSTLAFLTDRARLVVTKNVTGAIAGGGGRVRLTITAHGWLTGMRATAASIGGVTGATGEFELIRVDANTIELSGSTFGGVYTAGGTLTGPYVLSTPYTEASLVNPDGTCALTQVQSGDVIYLAGGGAPPQKLSRLAVDSWTLEQLDPDDGPFMDLNLDEDITVQSDATSGTVTLTATGGNIFTADHVGALIRIERFDTNGIQPWEPDITVGSTSNRKLSEGHEYGAVAASDGAFPSQTGTVQPTHTRGQAHDSGEGANIGILWEYLNSGYGVARITAFTSTTEVDAEVILPFPQGVMDDGSYRWQFGAWGDHNEYPKFVTLWKERLAFAGLRDVWMSKIAEYEKFAPDEFGEQVTESAVNIRIQSKDNNAIRWMEAAAVLFVGTADAEFVIAPATTSNPFGPTNRTSDAKSAYGGSGVPAVKVGKSVFFVEKNRRRAREILYDEGTAYQASDRTLLAEHITASGVVFMCHQRSPRSIIWAARTDGVLIGFTHEPEQEVFGWHRQPLGGSGIVESAASIPAPDGSLDDVFFAVRRTINGRTVRYIERLEDLLPEDGDQEDAFHVDCGLTYDGAPATTISGLGHLEGATVTISADGAAHPTRVVTGGAVTLQNAASVVHVGFGYRGRLKTMRIDAGAADGTSQAKTKRFQRCAIRLHRSLGGRVGTSFTSMEELAYRTPSMPMDAPPPLYSGDKTVTLNEGYETDGYLCVEQHQPLPMQVLALFPRVTTNDG